MALRRGLGTKLKRLLNHSFAGLLLLSGTVQGQTTTVEVDLVPCIIARQAIAKDVSAVTEAYLFNELFKGFWAGKQEIIIDPQGELDITKSATHGKCNAIFVGAPVTVDQYAQLTTYSATFKVRIVYFDNAETANLSAATSKLGVQQFFSSPLLNAPVIQLTAAATPRVVNADLRTNPSDGIFRRPVRQLNTTLSGGSLDIVAELADQFGNPLSNNSGLLESDYPGAGSSAAAVTYTGSDGSQEMHVFFAMAWFDMESWAWAHYIMEWGTAGVFQGERQFWLGTMVDDLFLSTNVFQYDGATNEGALERMTAGDLDKLVEATRSLNSGYNADIVTEFPLNGYGILEKVGSAFQFEFDDADAAQLDKGVPPTTNADGTVGLPPIKTPANWFNQSTIDGMTAEFSSLDWVAKDDLLAASLRLKDDIFLQSHTLAHLARDNLGQVDCESEDGGNVRVAIIAGLFDADTYVGRSMTNPGITGLFNKNCLESAVSYKMTCGPGDNTYDGVQTSVSLVSGVSQFHSIYTTEATNGYAGFQIVPRFATFVYFNCRSTDCLVLENLYIRRKFCECSSLDPGDVNNLNLDESGCSVGSGGKCPAGLQALGSVDNIFETEANTTARWIMNGRRDKYMFHQANTIPTSTPLGNISLLEYWYEVVLATMARYLNLQGPDPFPLKSVNFDDLCTNFKHHEELDGSGALITLTKTSDGAISGLALSLPDGFEGNVGVIPVTFPTSSVNEVITGALSWYSEATYGSDTTFYVASSDTAVPVALPKLTPADLPAVPAGTPPSPIPAPTPQPVSPPTPEPVAPPPPTPPTCRVYWWQWWCWFRRCC